MSTKLYISILVFMSFGRLVDAQINISHICRFDEGSVSIGLAPTLRFQETAFGGNVRAYYNIREKMCIGPEFTIVPSSKKETRDYALVFHYIIETDFAGFYPVIGLNYTQENENGEAASDWGWKYGIGAHRNFHSITVFAEYSRVDSDLRGDYFTAGLMYTILR